MHLCGSNPQYTNSRIPLSINLIISIGGKGTKKDGQLSLTFSD